MGEHAASPALKALLHDLERAKLSVDDARIREALSIAECTYEGKMHWSGSTMLQHVLSVTRELLPFSPDDDAIIGALLHHVLESPDWTLDELQERFGPSVRSIVSGIHLLSHVTVRNKRMSIDNLRLMFLRVTDDVRVVLIALCAKCSTLKVIGGLSQDQQVTICREVLRLYAPVAARLGIYSLKHRLENLAFPVVYPTDFERISEQVRAVHERHGHFLEGAAGTLARYLQDQGVSARVEVREKQPYSIFTKMRSKSVNHIDDLYDLYALRVIVADENACYQVLGLLHRIGHPVPNRFKDYIAFPKPNGYQSLHSTLARLPGVPERLFAEVQIRTEAMHREAEYGIAAHWSYKEGGAVRQAAQKAEFHRVLASQQAVGGGGWAASLKDQIFVLTPRGDIIELPEGSTPLDFAFHVHTDLGIAFRTARVNGSVVPMDYQLENGDVVEIVKHRDPHPSPKWMALLKTASARSRLRRYLVSQDKPTYVAMGKEALNAELERLGLPHLDPDLSLLRSVDGKTLTLAEREDFLLKIGQSTSRGPAVLTHIDALRTATRAQVDKAKRKRVSGSRSAIRLEGEMPMPYRFAKCCKPEGKPEKPVCGVVSRSGEVRIHLQSCRLLKSVNPERRIGAKWVSA